MKYRFLFFYFLAYSCFALTVKDDTSVPVYLSKPATRIISLAPDITEILFALGAEKQVVGVISDSNYPEAAKKIPIVGAIGGLDIERMVALKPDLIITWDKSFARQLSILQSKFGVAIYTTKPKQLEDIALTMKNLGALTGNVETARLKAQLYLQALNQLASKYQHQKPINVFYQIGNYSLLTINKESWINQAIELCGGRNVFAKARFAVPEISWEALLVANPQVIITDTTQRDWKDRWQKWRSIDAVKRNQLYAIDPDYIDRAGPRLILGVNQLCQSLEKARFTKNPAAPI